MCMRTDRLCPETDRICLSQLYVARDTDLARRVTQLARDTDLARRVTQLDFVYAIRYT